MTRMESNRRGPWRALLLGAAVLGSSATLAFSLHVRHITVEGNHRFSAAPVEALLRKSLGRPALQANALQLRAQVLTIPWVAEAEVRLGFDGSLRCRLSERTPKALVQEGGQLWWVDEERTLGPAPGRDGLPILEGFTVPSEEHQQTLQTLPILEAAWGAKVEHITRRGLQDVEVWFAGTPFSILVSLSHPHRLAEARPVLQAWLAQPGGTPQRADVRWPGRVVILPSQEATP